MLAAAAIMVLTFGDVQSASTPASARAQNYAEVIRCAGLTQAASELEGGESGDGRVLYDAALFWSLTAIQAGQAARLTASVTENQIAESRIRAVRELSNDDAPARASLLRCREQTPSLG